MKPKCLSLVGCRRIVVIFAISASSDIRNLPVRCAAAVIVVQLCMSAWPWRFVSACANRRTARRKKLESKSIQAEMHPYTNSNVSCRTWTYTYSGMCLPFIVTARGFTGSLSLNVYANESRQRFTDAEEAVAVDVGAIRFSVVD